MSKNFGLLAVVFIFTLSASPCFASTENNDSQGSKELKEFDSAGIESVLIENSAGDITLTGSATPKASVLATKKKFSDACGLTIDKKGAQLIAKVKSKGFFSKANCEVNFEIKTPQKVSIDLAAGSSNVSTSGTEGSLKFKLGSGDFTAQGTYTKIDAKTGSGNIQVKGLTGGGEIRTGSGDVTLVFANTPTPLTGEIDIKTGSGNSNLSFPKGSLIASDFMAGSGKLSNQLGDSPQAKFKVSARAGSGDLKITGY